MPSPNRGWSSGLRGQLCDSGVMHIQALADRSAALAGVEALQGFGALMVSELWFAAEADALGPGGLSSIIRSFEDAMPLVLGHSAQEGDKAAAQWRGEIEVRFVQHLNQGAAGVDAFDQVDAVEH